MKAIGPALFILVIFSTGSRLRAQGYRVPDVFGHITNRTSERGAIYRANEIYYRTTRLGVPVGSYTGSFAKKSPVERAAIVVDQRKARAALAPPQAPARGRAAPPSRWPGPGAREGPPKGAAAQATNAATRPAAAATFPHGPVPVPKAAETGPPPASAGPGPSGSPPVPAPPAPAPARANWDWDRAEAAIARFHDAFGDMAHESVDYRQILTTRTARRPLFGSKSERIDEEISRTKASIANLEKFKQYHARFKEHIERAAQFQPEAVEAWKWMVSVFQGQKKSEFTVPRMLNDAAGAYYAKKAREFEAKTIKLPEDFEATGRMLDDELEGYGNVVRALQIERKSAQIEDEILVNYDRNLDASQEEFYVWAMTKLKGWQEDTIPEGYDASDEERQGGARTHLASYRFPTSRAAGPPSPLNPWRGRAATIVVVFVLVLVAWLVRVAIKRRRGGGTVP